MSEPFWKTRELTHPKPPNPLWLARFAQDIYKSHLAETAGSFVRRTSNNVPVDSARANLSSTFVNAFVNTGFGSDKLMTTEGNEWLYKVSERAGTSQLAKTNINQTELNKTNILSILWLGAAEQGPRHAECCRQSGEHLLVERGGRFECCGQVSLQQGAIH